MAAASAPPSDRSDPRRDMEAAARRLRTATVCSFMICSPCHRRVREKSGCYGLAILSRATVAGGTAPPSISGKDAGQCSGRVAGRKQVAAAELGRAILGIAKPGDGGATLVDLACAPGLGQLLPRVATAPVASLALLALLASLAPLGGCRDGGHGGQRHASQRQE